MNANNKYNVTISAVVTRADGTIEDLGQIASTEDNTIEIKNKNELIERIDE